MYAGMYADSYTWYIKIYHTGTSIIIVPGASYK